MICADSEYECDKKEFERAAKKLASHLVPKGIKKKIQQGKEVKKFVQETKRRYGILRQVLKSQK